MRNIELFSDYENAKLITADEYQDAHKESTVLFDELSQKDVDGIPICVKRNGEGKLSATFIPDTHVLAIGATRSGKTTGFVVPTINLLLQRKNKPNLVISDPKQELFVSSAEKFREQGYRIILLDFTDYSHSDCWNPLTKYFRLYDKYLHVEDEITVVSTVAGPMPCFRGVIYEDQAELDRVINEIKDGFYDEVEKGITSLSYSVIPGMNKQDPFWEDSARDLFCAIIYGMLEDSESGAITEDNFSFDTILRIADTFSDAASTYDKGYFSSRDFETSKAYQLARKCILEQANNTRRCISSSFMAKMNKFRDTCVRRITCANTFEISELDDGAPAVIFVSYKDEEGLHYDIISMFLTNLYTELIALARRKGSRLERPFYFLLDEFGNLPPFNDFDKVISACGGRNIWFLLILQSYAQLYHIYGKETAEIIKDNLNTHIFFGTNNPETKREFSEECGKKTVIAPTSVLNGNGETIERFDKDTVALVPVSALNHINPGECIVTQMREDVIWSRIERCYLCPEFEGKKADPKALEARIRFSDPRYRYTFIEKAEKSDSDFKNPFDF